eukprot:228955-Pelagomonas_calceolata.AAC.4
MHDSYMQEGVQGATEITRLIMHHACKAKALIIANEQKQRKQRRTQILANEQKRREPEITRLVTHHACKALKL